MVRLLANAGVVVEGGGRRLMADGLFEDDPAPYSPVPQEVSDALVSGAAPFGRVDDLFFTHHHKDHFCARKAALYLGNNDPEAVAYPSRMSAAGYGAGWFGEGGGGAAGAGGKPVQDARVEARAENEKRLAWQREGLAGFEAALAARPSVEAFPMGFPIGAYEDMLTRGGLFVRAFNAGHIGEQFVGVDNYCAWFELAGLGVLVTGDADPLPDAFMQALQGTRTDVLVANSLFCLNRNGQGLIEGLIRPRAVCICHVPFASSLGEARKGFENSPRMIYKMGAAQVEKYRRMGLEAHLLDAPLQEVAFAA